MRSRCRSAAMVALAALSFAACQREKRDFRPVPARTIAYSSAAAESELVPGGSRPASEVSNPYSGSAYAVSEGQRLYDWYNCSGCHSHGGGGMGPPLIKQQWIYGHSPANLFETIVKGRPNGMPTWGGRIPEYQVWQLVAFVQSMNGKQPRGATPARLDRIELNPHDLQNRVPGVTK
jgi:cytochrome c oxidase cbb3-type subunit III